VATGETFLVLGGGGMIGRQVVHEIARELKPRWVILCSLHQKEVREAIDFFRREFPYVRFLGFWGDVFIRAQWNVAERQTRMTRSRLLDSSEYRAALYDDLFGDLEDAYSRSQLVQLILEHKPDVVIDSINTATSISYQDIYAASDSAKKRFSAVAAELEGLNAPDGEAEEPDAANRAPPAQQRRMTELVCSAEQALDRLLISQSVPQLVRHVLLLNRAMSEAETRLYLKVGTTGTGGMGLNIPYTHSEDKPSVSLMSKTAIAFAHTGLMFLMARTPGGPVVKEIKPGAMVGYANITQRAIHERGKPVYVFTDRLEPLGAALTVHEPERDFERLGKLHMVVVDTGENGVFTGGEFEAITHLWQMEFITPEEIARQAVLEIKGSNTGHDVIAAIDGAVMNPTYRAGYLRHRALEDVARLEETTDTHSVALGQLGPPELGKLLWEAYLLKLQYVTLSAVMDESEEALACELYARVQSDDALRRTITSVGLPILTPDGCALMRGPLIRIPESPNVSTIPISLPNMEKWADKGWVDLRPKNMRRWQQRFQRMRRDSQRLKGRGSAAFVREAYLSDEILIGEVVAWIFNNEELGHRIK